MRQLFVTLQLAEAAKKAGFNEPCLSWVHRNHDILMSGGSNSSGFTNDTFGNGGVTLPTWQQLKDWFREKHNLVVMIDIAKNDDLQVIFYPIIYVIKDEMIQEIDNSISGNDYYDVLERTLLYAFVVIGR